MIIACVSTYKDGHLLAGAIESARRLDSILVADGPWGGRGGAPRDQVTTHGETGRREGTWESDAAKRTYLLGWAKHVHGGKRNRKDPLWVLWLDGDEVLLWGEYLADMALVAQEQTGGGGFPLRLVELDGSVVDCRGKVIRADAVRRYLHSSYQVETPTGMTVALPNIPLCSAGGIPFRPPEWAGVPGMIEPHQPTPEEQNEWLAKCRPPVAGEPHLLHRSALRSGERTVRRGSDVEGDWFKEQLKEQGLEAVDQ